MDSIADWQCLILRPQFQTAGVFLYFHIFLNILDTFSYQPSFRFQKNS